MWIQNEFIFVTERSFHLKDVTRRKFTRLILVLCGTKLKCKKYGARSSYFSLLIFTHVNHSVSRL